MEDLLPLSPVGWWLLKFAIAVAITQWAMKTLKKISVTVIGAALFLYLLATVPGVDAKVVHFYHNEIQPRLSKIVQIGGRGVEKGVDGYINTLDKATK